MSRAPIQQEYEAILRELKVLCLYRVSRTNRYEISLLNSLPVFSLFIKMSMKGNRKESVFWSNIAKRGDELQRKSIKDRKINHLVKPSINEWQ